MASQGGRSRLAQMQMRFQQKQQQEREQRKVEMTGTRTVTETTEAKSLNSTMGTGKVRQMFDERRQRGTGIDKSYPLKPIATRTTPSSSTTTKTMSSSTVARKKQTTSTITRQANSRTSSSETTLVTKKTSVLNGNAVVPSKGNLSARTTGTAGSPNHDDQLPNIDKLSLDDNKNLNGYASGDKNNNSKNDNTSSTSSTIKLKPVVTKKVAPEPRLQKRAEESSLSSSSSRLLSPASDRSAPTRSSPKTNAKPTSTSESRMAAATPRGPVPSTPPENMAACRICARHFNVDRIEKHQQICEKAAVKKRKIFDAAKHRVKGTEAEQYVRRAVKSSGPKAAPKKPVDTSKKSNWRRKHEEFIEAIRAAKVMQAHLAKGGKLSDLPPPPPSENPDYVQCPHCKRRFNEGAATRHIPKCADMLHNKPKPGAAPKRAVKR